MKNGRRGQRRMTLIARHNFPSLKYYYSNIASTCTRVYIARVTLRLYHTRRTLHIYIYILQVIDDIEVFHME